ncbi:uncharacterized protein LOC128643998 [Bombina bombina]|uniref:uncharacterized protein LOC128643998 n=1 Tax=Bombina bombina TaxID=8345 RepID=UPI00235A78E7|nr:uncharacterized protein LOC128643998 [Bombina bombina]
MNTMHRTYLLLTPVLTLLLPGYVTPALSPVAYVVWSVEDERQQAQLLCLVQGLSDVGVTIWFSSGNGTSQGTVWAVSLAPSAKLVMGSQEFIFSSGSLHPQLVSQSGRKNTTIPLPSKDLLSVSRYIGDPSPVPSQGLSAFVLLSISGDELKLWDSVICSVAEEGSEKVWASRSLSYPGENRGAETCSEDHSLKSDLQFLTFRLLIFKVATFDLLMTCAAFLETWWDVTHREMRNDVKETP